MSVPKGGIAFFDSGIGGLTVLSECRKVLPQELFYYYGDNKRAPYGNLSVKKIEKYVYRIFKKLARLNVRAVVIACNTVTALCIDGLRKKYSFPILGAEPAVFPAAAKGGRVFVLSTRATFESERFRALCERAKGRFPKTEIAAYACDDLAGKIERQLFNKNADFTSALPKGKPTTVVLGCTHYVYIAKQVQKFYGCEVLDGNKGIAQRLRNVLRETQKKCLFYHENPPDFSSSKRVDHSATIFDHEEGKKREKTANKRSFFKLRNPFKQKEKREIFFLGSGKNINERTFKQMFGVKVVF